MTRGSLLLSRACHWPPMRLVHASHPGYSWAMACASGRYLISVMTIVYARTRHCTALLGRDGYLATVQKVIMRDGPVAPWRQIAQIYRDRIASGELAPGDRLPSIRSISQEYEVATTTAQKVLEALRDEGLVVTSPMGTFVAERTSGGVAETGSVRTALVDEGRANASPVAE